MKILICALTLSFTMATVFAADILYVQSNQAKIFTDPSFQSQRVVTVNKGAALTLLATSDSWVKVSYQQHTGWIASLLVNKKPPQEKITVIKDADNDAQKDAVRRRASASASAAAARGLRQDERARASDQSQTNYPAVEKMEATQVNEKDVETFMQAPAK